MEGKGGAPPFYRAATQSFTLLITWVASSGLVTVWKPNALVNSRNGVLLASSTVYIDVKLFAFAAVIRCCIKMCPSPRCCQGSATVTAHSHSCSLAAA